MRPLSHLNRLNRFAMLLVLVLAPAVPASLCAGYTRWQRQHPGDPLPEVVVHALSARAPILWIDARSVDSALHQPIPWAMRLSEETWEQDLPAVVKAIQPDAALVVFCDPGRCQSSTRVADRLRSELGVQTAWAVPGGVPNAERLRARLAVGETP